MKKPKKLKDFEEKKLLNPNYILGGGDSPSGDEQEDEEGGRGENR